jgi:hypothetical protein
MGKNTRLCGRSGRERQQLTVHTAADVEQIRNLATALTGLEELADAGMAVGHHAQAFLGPAHEGFRQGIPHSVEVPGPIAWGSYGHAHGACFANSSKQEGTVKMSNEDIQIANANSFDLPNNVCTN